MTTATHAPKPVLAHVMEDEMEGTASRGAERNTDGKRRLRRTGAMAVLLTSVALIAGACGSGDEPKKTVASVAPQAGSTSATQASSGKGDILAQAKCMRENGLPDFKDPVRGQPMGTGLDTKSPEFKKAREACKQYEPSGGTAPPVAQDPWPSADKLKYSQCMRTNGVPSFPDPDASGNFPPLIKGGAVDPESPQFKKADEACKKYQPQNMKKMGPGGGS
jgi:hypothetical protein